MYLHLYNSALFEKIVMLIVVSVLFNQHNTYQNCNLIQKSYFSWQTKVHLKRCGVRTQNNALHESLASSLTTNRKNPNLTKRSLFSILLLLSKLDEINIIQIHQRMTVAPNKKNVTCAKRIALPSP